MVSGNVVYLHVISTATPTFTTLGAITTPQVYGGVTLCASVVTNTGIVNAGSITFKDGATVLGTASVTNGTACLATILPVNGGAAHPIQAHFNSDPEVIYGTSLSGVQNVVITARVITVTGAKTYDGLPMVVANNLVVANNVDGANLTLQGAAVLTGKNVGSEAIVNTNCSTPTRVQLTGGNSGGSTPSATFVATLTNVPANGNTLVAVIGTTGTNSSTITSITQANVTNWTRVVQAANQTASGNGANNGVTTEIWYATVGAGAGKAVTINQIAAVRSAAVVIEYSGLLTTAPVDQTANATGLDGSPVTGTTLTTTLGNELWIGGIAFTNSGYTLTNIQNSFDVARFTNSTYTIAAANVRIYAIENTNVAAIGMANSGGSMITATHAAAFSYWAGAIATFYTVPCLSLAGPAAPNYTTAGVSGTVTVAPTNLTVSASAYSKTYDGTTAALGTPTITAGSIQPGDSVTGTWTEVFASRNAGASVALTPVGVVVNDGNNGLNYNYIPGSVTGVIAQTNLTVTAVSNTKGYDGNTSAAAVPLITAGSIQTGDFAPVWTETYDNATVGTGKTLTPAGLVLDGNNGLNYSYAYIPDDTGVITNSVIVSTVNDIQSIAKNANGTYTIHLLGTPGAQYYVVASGNINAHMSTWTPVLGGTNTASSPSGMWSIVVSNSVPAYYRSIAVNPAH